MKHQYGITFLAAELKRCSSTSDTTVGLDVIMVNGMVNVDLYSAIITKVSNNDND